MKWKDILEKWYKEPLKYPDNIKNSFFWETKPITNEKSIFKQKFIQNEYLNNLKQNYSPFQNEINKSKNKYVTSFYNLSGDTLLIVPIPKKGKNFATLKNFIDNASKTQQEYLWKEVSKQIKKLLKKNKGKPLWVSTHGTGVHYLHIRICNKPKYYLTKSFMK